MEYHYFKFVNQKRWYLNALNMFIFEKALYFQKSWNHPNKMLTFQTVELIWFLGSEIIHFHFLFFSDYYAKLLGTRVHEIGQVSFFIKYVLCTI